MSKTTLTFLKEKDTKNTVRYTEVPAKDEAPVIGTLYVQKFFAKGAEKLTVTIEKEDN